jgi:hypothetical protein
MNFIIAPYADASANRRGWGEIGDGSWSELQRDPRHWGGFIPFLVDEAKIIADEEAGYKAA